MLEDDASSENGSDSNIPMKAEPFKINTDYAKRFEHNKKREELQRLQEKYGDEVDDDGAAGSEEDSDSETEDEEAVLATEALDAEIFATLNAIKNKDPRVYDEKVTFYTPEDEAARADGESKPKPVYLRDYHRENLLKGDEDGETSAPMSYAYEQANIKRNLVKEMHAGNAEAAGSESEDGDLLVRKTNQKYDKVAPRLIPDVKNAEKDPETFLSNFLAARAWLPTTSSKLQPFNSDDEEEDRRADEFENAYNMRFEDPKRANEKLLSHSREAAAKYSVRREEPKGRKRAREEQKSFKDLEKEKRTEEKARLRRLKIEEAHEKLQKFKEAAGLGRQEIQMEDWASFLEAGWDNDQWNQEMAKRFGDNYYQDAEHGSATDEEEERLDTRTKKMKKKAAKKPTWNDDIDVLDLVPDFKEEEDKIELSDEEEEEEEEDDGGVVIADNEAELDNARPRKASKKKQAQLDRADKKRTARKERAKIEEFVDQNLLVDSLPDAGTSGGPKFQYRETSPSTYGLSTLDILMADDSALNQFVGLKKLAPFRDAEKKSRDKKKLGKKARLRQWRKDTFGDENGPPQTSFQDVVSPPGANEELTQADEGAVVGDVSGEKKKKKRSRKNKGKANEETVA